MLIRETFLNDQKGYRAYIELFPAEKMFVGWRRGLSRQQDGLSARGQDSVGALGEIVVSVRRTPCCPYSFCQHLPVLTDEDLMRATEILGSAIQKGWSL